MTRIRDDLSEIQELIRLAPGKLIAARIRQARRTAGLSHDRLGERAGTSRSHLIKLEKAWHRPGATLLIAIAQATERPVDFFLVEEAGEPNPFPDED